MRKLSIREEKLSGDKRTCVSKPSDRNKSQNFAAPVNSTFEKPKKVSAIYGFSKLLKATPMNQDSKLSSKLSKDVSTGNVSQACETILHQKLPIQPSQRAKSKMTPRSRGPNLTRDFSAKTEKSKPNLSRPSHSVISRKEVFLNNHQSALKQLLYQSRGSMKDYNIGRELGRGSFSVVRYATLKRENSSFAIKMIPRHVLNSPQLEASFVREVGVLRSVNHPNIVEFRKVFEEDQQVCIVMEFAGASTLQDFFSKNLTDSHRSEKMIFSIFLQLLEAVTYLHSLDIAHLDLKFENIAITKDQKVKLIDFGFARLNASTPVSDIWVGTPQYMSPELLRKDPYIPKQADAWALGVLLYKLCAREFPYRGLTPKEVLHSLEKQNLSIEGNVANKFLADIIGKLLNKSPRKRVKLKDLLAEARQGLSSM